jgi:hypothetical protein
LGSSGTLGGMPGGGRGRPVPKAFGARVNPTSINTAEYFIGDEPRVQ